MQKIFSTDGLHPRDRFDCWHEVACKQICGHLSEPDSAATFEAELFARQLADLKLFKFRNAPMAVSRTHVQIAQADTDDIFICRPLAGRLVLEQQGREAMMEAGDFCLLDPLMPYSGRFDGKSKLFIVAVARRSLEARVGSVSAMSLLQLGESAMGELTSSYLALLPKCATTAEPHRAAMFQEQVLDLLAESLAEIKDDGKPTLSSPRAVSEAKLRAVVGQNLCNPAFSPSMAARLGGISVRYANALLAEKGTSLYRFILSQRLDRCRRALQDPTQARRTVTEIALSWGFTDLPYFSRSFKAAFGLSPRDYRAAAIAAALLT
jgi:AraC family transcriptional activator of tynA and feaB